MEIVKTDKLKKAFNSLQLPDEKFISEEILYNKLMERIRNALDEGTFDSFRCEYSEKLSRRI